MALGVLGALHGLEGSHPSCRHHFVAALDLLIADFTAKAVQHLLGHQTANASPLDLRRARLLAIVLQVAELAGGAISATHWRVHKDTRLTILVMHEGILFFLLLLPLPLWLTRRLRHHLPLHQLLR